MFKFLKGMFSKQMGKASVKEADLSEWFATASRDTREHLPTTSEKP